MTGGTVFLIALGLAIIAVAVFIWWTLPRWPEDYFEVEMAALATFTSDPRSVAPSGPRETGGPVHDDGTAFFIHDDESEGDCPAAQAGGPSLRRFYH